MTPRAFNQFCSSGFSSQQRPRPSAQEDVGDKWRVMSADTDVQKAARVLFLERPHDVIHLRSISPCEAPTPWPGCRRNTTICVFSPLSASRPQGQTRRPAFAALPPPHHPLAPHYPCSNAAILGVPDLLTKVTCAQTRTMRKHLKVIIAVHLRAF